VAGFVLKGLLMPAIGHGDLWFNTDVARGVGGGGWNVYDGVEKQLASRYPNLAPDAVAPYGPAYYVPLWGYHRLEEAVGIADPDECDAACELGRRPLFWGLNAKLPHLLADGLCVLLLLVLLPARIGRRAAVLWATSPGLLYVFYVMGQNDLFPIATIIVAFCLLASTRFPSGSSGKPPWWIRHREALAMVVLGIGGAMKLLPLFFAIVFALAIRRSVWRALGLASLSIASLLVLSLPFVGSDYFVHGHLRSTRAVFLLTPEVFGFNLFALAALATVLAVRSPRSAGREQRLLVALLGMSTAVALFHDFNPQRGSYLVAAVAVAAAYVPLPTIVLLVANAVVLLHPFTASALGPKTLVYLNPVFNDLRALVDVFAGADYTTAARLVTRSAVVVAIVSAIVVVLRRPEEPEDAAPHRLRQPVLLLVGCAGVVGLLVFPLVLGRWGPDSGADITSTGDVSGSVVRQSFVAPYDHLEQIDVYIDPFGHAVRRYVDLRLLAACTEGAGILRHTRGDLFTLLNGRAAYVPFKFPTLQNAQGLPLCFELDFRPFDDGRPVGLVLAPKAQAAAATLHDTVVANPVAFRDRYTVPLGGVASSTARRVGREWPVAVGSPALAAMLGLGVVLLATRRRQGTTQSSPPLAP
jgi:hypothetical protein